MCTAGRMNSKTSYNSNPDRNYSIPVECLLETFKTATQIFNVIMHQRKKLKILSNI